MAHCSQEMKLAVAEWHYERKYITDRTRVLSTLFTLMVVSCSETLPIIPLEPSLHLINSKKAGVSRPDLIIKNNQRWELRKYEPRKGVWDAGKITYWNRRLLENCTKHHQTKLWTNMIFTTAEKHIVHKMISTSIQIGCWFWKISST
jgi:hypothetical protein